MFKLWKGGQQEKMQETITPNLFDGEILKCWKEPGIYIIDFPTLQIKIPEDDWDKVKEEMNLISSL